MAGFSSVTSALTQYVIGQLAYGADANMLAREYTLEDAVDVPPGRGVVYDSVNNSCKLPAGAVTGFLGLSFDDGSLAIEDAAFSATGNPRVPVLQRGDLPVMTSEAVDPTDAVFLQHTDGGAGKPVGSFRTDNDGGNAAQVSNCTWTDVFASGKAVLRINLP